MQYDECLDFKFAVYLNVQYLFIHCLSYGWETWMSVFEEILL